MIQCPPRPLDPIVTRSPTLAVLLLLLAGACSDSPAAPVDPTPSGPLDGTIHLLSFYDLHAFAEGVPCADVRPEPLPLAGLTKRRLEEKGEAVRLVAIGDTLVNPMDGLKGRPSRFGARGRARVVLDALAAAGCDLYVPGHADFDLFGAESLLAEAEKRGITVLLTNAQKTDAGRIEPYVIVQHGTLRLALLGTLSPKDGDGNPLVAKGLVLIQPKRRVKEVADGILDRGEADMVAVLGNLPGTLNQRVAEINSVHFLVGTSDPGLAADMVVRWPGAAIMAAKGSGREVAQSTFRVVDGDMAMVDLSPLWALPPVLADEAENLRVWEQQYGTTDPMLLAQRVLPSNTKEFIDKYSLHQENLEWVAEFADYEGSSISHHVVRPDAIPADDPVLAILADQGPAITEALKVLETEPPTLDGDTRIASASDCMSCHSAQFEHWEGTSHSQAYEHLKPLERQHDATCLSCHAAGFGVAGSGYKDPRLEAPFGGFTCWNCHAVNELHHASRTGALEPDNVPISDRDHIASRCDRCHGPRRSPGFDLDAAMDVVACPPMRFDEPAIIETYAKALAAFDRNRMSASYEARDLYLEGRALIGLGRVEEGLELVHRYADGVQGSLGRVVEIADYLDRMGDSAGAIERMRTLVRDHPGNPDAHIGYAHLLVHAKDESVRDPGMAATHMGVVAPFEAREKMEAQELPFRTLQVEALFESGRKAEGRELLVQLANGFRENPKIQELVERYLKP